MVTTFYRFIKYLPLLAIISCKKDEDLLSDIRVWKQSWNIEKKGIPGILLLLSLPEFRNVLFYRMNSRLISQLSKIYKGQTTLYIQVKGRMGKGLMIWHGFSTIINCESIGDYCSIWQQVTIGNKLDTDGKKPRIGNNVKICAGAIVIGDITIGDNVIVGAGSVVVKDVPNNVIVAGVPARIIKRIENE